MLDLKSKKFDGRIDKLAKIRMEIYSFWYPRAKKLCRSIDQLERNVKNTDATELLHWIDKINEYKAKGYINATDIPESEL